MGAEPTGANPVGDDPTGDPTHDEGPDHGTDPQEPVAGRRSGEDDQRPPPGVDALQSAAREAIDATRALLDVAEALVNDPEMVDRVGSVVRAATGAATRAARAAGSAAQPEPRDHRDDDDDDGVQRIPVV